METKKNPAMQGLCRGGRVYITALIELKSYAIFLLSQFLRQAASEVVSFPAAKVAPSKFIPPKPLRARYKTHTTLASSFAPIVDHSTEAGSRRDALMDLTTVSVR